MPAPGIFLVDRLDLQADVVPITTDEQVLTRDNDTGKYLGRAVPQTTTLAAAGGSSMIGFLQTGTGAVLRTLAGHAQDRCSVKDFGAVGDGVTDDLAAFHAAIRHAAVIANSRGRCVWVPFGVYRLSGSLRISRNVVLTGEVGSGNTAAAASYAGSTLLFDAGVTGIIVDRETTSPDGGRGDHSTIAHIDVQAASKTGTVHGIQLHARAHLHDVHVKNFSGNGIHIVASLPTNANCWLIDGLSRVEDCTGFGLYVQGSDVNAGKCIGLDISLCTAGGVKDESFLGNSYVALHVDTAGGPTYATTGSTNKSVFLGCYAEEGQPAARILRPSMVIGGNMEQDEAFTTAPLLDVYASRSLMVKNALCARNTREARIIEAHLGYDDTSRTAFAMQYWNGISLVDDYRWAYETEEEGWWSLTRNGLQAETPIAISGDEAPEANGRVRFRNGIYLNVGLSRREVRVVDSRPANGTGQTGDIAFFNNPSLGGPAAYVCHFNGSTTLWQDSLIVAPFDTAHTWFDQQTHEANVNMVGVLQAWDAANLSVPSVSNDALGTRLLLYPEASPANSYKLGVEAGALWLNSNDEIKFYRGAAEMARFGAPGLVFPASRGMSMLDVAGVDIGGNTLLLTGGRGTGAGAAGALRFQIAHAGSSGSGVNTLADRFVSDGVNTNLYVTPGSTDTLMVRTRLPASIGNTTRDVAGVALRGAYWTGAVSADVDVGWDLDVVDTAPTYHWRALTAGIPRMFIAQDGKVTFGAAALTTGLVNVNGTLFLNGAVTIATGNDFVFGTTGAGSKFGTAANQKMGLWGKTPIVQPTALTAADASTVDVVYGAEEVAVVNNIRTRLNELEARLSAWGFLP